MSACYSVTLTAAIKDEQGALATTQKFIRDAKNTDFGLVDYLAQGVDISSLEGLIRVLLAGRKENSFTATDSDDGFRIYDSGFNASYGWESVMIEWFEAIAPHLADGSRLLIYPDSDFDLLVVEQGKAITKH